MSCETAETKCKHVNASKPYYSDWTAELAQMTGVALSSGVVTLTGVTVGAVSVTVAEVTDVDDAGGTITIAAGNAFQFNLSGGTASAEPIKGTVDATFDDGTTDSRTIYLKVYE